MTAGNARFPARIVDAVRRKEWGFPEFFVLSQSVLPALLYIPGTQSIRVVIRVAPFLLSLLGLAWYCRSRSRSRVSPPAQKWLLICLGYLVLMIFVHPGTNSLLSGLAQTMLYLSVLAPLFWATRLRYTPERIQRLLFIVLVCSGVNSLVGVLQVYDPGTWLPVDFSSIVKSQEGYLQSLTYIRPDGSQVVRPPGLSDSPGAVCGPAATAIVLGLIIFFSPVSVQKRAIALASASLGFAAVFMSHVRSSLLVACGAILVYIGLLVMQRQVRKAALMSIVGVLLVTGSFLWAVALGGEAVDDRFTTLFESDPVSVYNETGRGGQIQYAFETEIFDYPAGAGLGRWGMMRYYFGDPSNPNSPPLWAELQPNAWILDGGIVLLLFYPIALFVTTWDQLKIARLARSPNLRSVAAAVLAINATVLGLVFGYTPFTTQIGLQFWFLSGVLFSATYTPAEQ